MGSVGLISRWISEIAFEIAFSVKRLLPASDFADLVRKKDMGSLIITALLNIVSAKKWSLLTFSHNFVEFRLLFWVDEPVKHAESLPPALSPHG